MNPLLCTAVRGNVTPFLQLCFEVFWEAENRRIDI